MSGYYGGQLILHSRKIGKILCDCRRKIAEFHGLTHPNTAQTGKPLPGPVMQYIQFESLWQVHVYAASASKN